MQILGVRSGRKFILLVFEDGKVGAAEALLRRAIGKPYAVAVLRSAGHISHDADTSTRFREDFGAFRDDDVNLFLAIHNLPVRSLRWVDSYRLNWPDQMFIEFFEFVSRNPIFLMDACADRLNFVAREVLCVDLKPQ